MLPRRMRTLKTACEAIDVPLRVGGESGVYRSPQARRVAVRTEPSWEEDDEITGVYHPAPTRSAQPTLVPRSTNAKRAVWQVAMHLHGDELMRFWLRSGPELRGKLFVWSQYANEWVALQVPQSAAPQGAIALEPAGIRADSPISIEPSAATRRREAERNLSAQRQQVDPVDVTAHARWLAPKTSHWRLPGVVAAICGLLASATWVSHLPSSTANATESYAPKFAASGRSTGVGATRHVESVVVASAPKSTEPDFVRVEALPLVTAGAPARVSRLHSAETAPTEPSTLVLKAFDPVEARRALALAIGRARACTAAMVAGSALVTFSPKGTVTGVSLASVAGDFEGYACVANALHAARVAPFSGHPITVKKRFYTTS